MNISNYIRAVDFHNIAEARVILHKARMEHYPEKFVEDLKHKIEEYETLAELDTERAMFPQK